MKTKRQDTYRRKRVVGVDFVVHADGRNRHDVHGAVGLAHILRVGTVAAVDESSVAYMHNEISPTHIHSSQDVLYTSTVDSIRELGVDVGVSLDILQHVGHLVHLIDVVRCEACILAELGVDLHVLHISPMVSGHHIQHQTTQVTFRAMSPKSAAE